MDLRTVHQQAYHTEDQNTEAQGRHTHDNLDVLPPRDVLQQEITKYLEAALASFRDVAVGLQR